MKKRFIFIVIIFSLFLISCNKNTEPAPKIDSECKLTIVYNLEGVENTVITYKYADVVELPENTNRNFLGWTFDMKEKTILTEGFMIYKDETIYALYREVKNLSFYDLSQINFETMESSDIDIVKKDKYCLYKDITYKVVNGVKLKLNIYYPNDGAESHPVLFSYYGGGWIAGSKESTYLNDVYASVLDAGFVVVAPNYRLCNGSVSYPSPVEDCLDAIRYIVKYKDVLKIDCDMMGSVGYSAGAHLALMAAFAQDHFAVYEPLKEYTFKLKFVVDYFAPAYYEASEIENIGATGLVFLGSYLGTTEYSNPELAKAFPSYYITENNPLVYIIQGTNDDTVPFTQSIAFFNLCKENNITCEMLAVEGGSHMLNPSYGYSKINPSLEEVHLSAANFIKQAAGK